MTRRTQTMSAATAVVAIGLLSACSGGSGAGVAGATLPPVPSAGVSSPAVVVSPPVPSEVPTTLPTPPAASIAPLPTGSTSPTVSSPSPSTPLDATNAARRLAAFVAQVRAKVPDVAAGRGDPQIAAVATAACAGLAARVPADALVSLTRTLGTLDASATDRANARELIKLAIHDVCPSQAGRVDEF